jgi:Zn-dependent oligopeptidase
MDLETVCEYFSFGVAMEGLNELFQSLYGVELVVEETREGELWAQDVFKLGSLIRIVILPSGVAGRRVT